MSLNFKCSTQCRAPGASSLKQLAMTQGNKIRVRWCLPSKGLSTHYIPLCSEPTQGHSAGGLFRVGESEWASWRRKVSKATLGQLWRDGFLKWASRQVEMPAVLSGQGDTSEPLG